MRSFALAAALTAMAFCSSDLMAQDCGCSGGNSYAAPMTYGTPVQYSASTAAPMMVSYASQGCSGCYQTSMAPATYTANYSNGCGSGSSCCGGTYASSNAGCCDTNACCGRRGLRRARRSCCSNSCCGQTYTSAPVSGCCSQPVQSGCGCGSSNRGMVYGGMATSGCGCGSTGMVYGNGMMYGGQMMTSGCSDCVGNVPATMQSEGVIVDGAPVPADDTQIETEEKVDTPPTPDDT